MPATTFAELFGGTWATAAQVEDGVTHGPTGTEITGTATFGSGGTTQPPSANTATGYTHTMYNGVVVAGVQVSVRLESGPGISGLAIADNVWCKTSDSNGYVEFVGLHRGATYSVWIGDDFTSKATFVVPDLDTFTIDEVVGTK